MKTEQPLWGRGQMVSPQHFQQQAAYAAWSAECIARLGLSHPWGVIEATFEPDALKLGRLQARHLHIRFPDGTLIDTDNADDLPPVLALESESNEVVVMLALPLLRANGGNCLKPDEVAGRPVRYRQRWQDIRNTFGDDIDSPLPTAYLDDIAQRREGHDALQGFLDIFSHRILTQFYRIWRKYSYPATFEPGGTDSISQSLLGLVGLGIPGTADHIATPVSRFLALLGVLQQPGKTQEGMQALVTLLAPETTVKVSPYCLRPVEIGQPLGFYGDDDFLLDGNTPLGDEAMDAGSQLLVALRTDNEQEAQGWKPDGLLYLDFMVMLRVWLGWRFKAKLTLTTRTRLLAVPPLGEGPFWLGMNGVLGADEGEFTDDIPPTFTTELGYYTGLKPAISQQGNRRVTYKFN